MPRRNVLVPGSKCHNNYTEYKEDCRYITTAGYPLTINTKTSALRWYVSGPIAILFKADLAKPEDICQFDASVETICKAYQSWIIADAVTDFNLDDPQLCSIGLGSQSVASTVSFDIGQQVIATLIKAGADKQGNLIRFLEKLQKAWELPEDATILSAAAVAVASIKSAANTICWIYNPSVYRGLNKSIITNVLLLQSAASAFGTASASGSAEELIGVALLETSVWKTPMLEIIRLSDHLQKKISEAACVCCIMELVFRLNA